MLNSLVGIIASSGGAAGGAYESIASTTVGAGGAANVTFSSIPSTYQHLQVRYSLRTVSANLDDEIYVTINGNGSSNANHLLTGNGGNVTAEGLNYSSVIYIGKTVGGGSTSNIFGAGIIDIHDYANTTRNKTIRVFNGMDTNSTTGYVNLGSGFNFTNQNAITSFAIRSNSNWAQNTVVSLYGIKGA
jgi:hypothetical protein